MSTKKLDRTAIEGGRRQGYKYERKQSLRSARRGVNSALDAMRDPDEFYDMDFVERKRSSYWSGEKFNDRLGAIKRWMKSQVGKPWDEVYSLLRKRFDTRTTAGRHILFDHMVNMVWKSQDHTTRQSEYKDYYVNAEGILCENPNYWTWRRHRYNSDWKAIREERKVIGEWLNGRLIGKVGEVLYWFESTRPTPNPIHLQWDYNIGFRFIYWSGQYWREWLTPYRQGVRLQGKDVEFFSKLNERNKEVLLSNSPLIKKYSGPYHGPF